MGFGGGPLGYWGHLGVLGSQWDFGVTVVFRVSYWGFGVTGSFGVSYWGHWGHNGVLGSQGVLGSPIGGLGVTLGYWGHSGVLGSPIGGAGVTMDFGGYMRAPHWGFGVTVGS